ncbi:hypothetical protein KY332_03515 [Candidatus Woesearchaeota archaeon]|nr:hypothetical protein [Candidatus Woesearchaeota archaeon]
MEKDDEITVDFGKIGKLFKKKKQEKASSEAREVEKEIDEDIKKEEIKIKELKEDEIEEEEKIDKLKQEKKELEEAKEVIEEQEKKIDILEKKEDEEKQVLEEEKKKVEDIKEEVAEIEEKDEEVSLDLKKVKGWFKGGKKEEKVGDEEISVDLKGTAESISKFFKGNKWALPVLLILIAIIFSTFFRMYSAELPKTEKWAQSSVYTYYKNQISGQINQQYPNLPDANKKNLINNEFSSFLKENKEMVEQQIEATSKNFKSQMQYTAENGKDYTYLLAIDPYLWYGETRNYLENGHFGTEVVDGEEINFLRNGREGREMPNIKFHSLFGAWLYKLDIFSDRPLMAVFFLIPVLIIAASIIPAFFIGKRMGGNFGGFFTAMIIAVNSALLGRTPAGFSDTDAYNIFFPLMIVWLFLKAFESKDLKKQAVYAGLSGLCVGLYSLSWGGWWYVFDFILATIGIYFIYLLAMKFWKSREIDTGAVKNLATVGGLFFVVSAMFVTLLQGFRNFTGFIRGPLNIIALKDVAVTTLWPNVLTTVAEFNVVKLGTIIAQMGGNLLFFIAIVGIILSLFKKNEEGKVDVKYAILLTIWFLGTAYGFTKGVRFAILMVPAFAVAFGVGVGILYEYLNRWVAKEMHINNAITKTVLIVLFCLLLIAPLKAAHVTAENEIPSMNDQWYNALTAIKEDSSDGIITSWWDFGHWFVAIAERRVTFDGADQGERIHWVGKSLLTESEEEAVGILRMLNCGQQKAPHVLEEYLEGDTVRAIDILNKIILEDKKIAELTLKKEGLIKEKIEDVLEVTHCDDLIDQYYIASEDMVGKSGVWGHFGSWDFKKAKMWQTVRKMDYSDGIKVLTEEFGLSEGKADEYYYEIQNNKADQWVASWPSYAGGRKGGCQIENRVAKCVGDAGQLIPVEINLKTYEAVIPTNEKEMHPNSIVYVDGKDVKKKEYKEDTIGLSVILVPNGNSYYVVLSDPLQAYSMFARLFYFKGHGLKNFDLLDYQRQVTGGEIYTYKVDWAGKSKLDAYEDKAEIIAEPIIEETEAVEKEDAVENESSKEKEFEIEI